MIYLISAIFTIAMPVLVIFRPLSITPCIAVKALSIPVIYFLNSEMTKGLSTYFYINLGISRKEYYTIPFVVDFISFILLIIITGTIGYAIR